MVRVWKVPDSQSDTHDIIEEHYVATTKRMSDGKCMVKVPEKEDKELCESYHRALGRLRSQEKKTYPSKAVVAALIAENDDMQEILDRFSPWTRMKRTIALRFSWFEMEEKGKITTKSLKQVENATIAGVPRQHYKPIPPRSKRIISKCNLLTVLLLLMTVAINCTTMVKFQQINQTGLHLTHGKKLAVMSGTIHVEIQTNLNVTRDVERVMKTA